MKENNTVTFTIGNRKAHMTDWDYVKGLKDKDLSKALEEDKDAAPFLDQFWFQRAKGCAPTSWLTLDTKVVQWFQRKNHEQYQNIIEQILRQYIEKNSEGPKQHFVVNKKPLRQIP